MHREYRDNEALLFGILLFDGETLITPANLVSLLEGNFYLASLSNYFYSNEVFGRRGAESSKFGISCK